MRIALIFFLITVKLSAQFPDSLQIKLSQLNSQEAKIEFIDSLANISLRNNLDLHETLVNKGLSISLNLENDSLYNHFLIKRGTNFVYKDQFDSARAIFNLVLTNADNSYQRAVVYSELGISYYYESNDSKALENFTKSYEMWIEVGDTTRLAGITNNIGVLQRYLGDRKSAIKYLKKAVLFKTAMGETITLASSLHNLGINYEEMGQTDSAFYYFKRANAIQEQYNDLRGLAKSYNSLSTLYANLDQMDSAEYYILKAIEVDEKLNDQIALPADQINLAGIYQKKEQHKEAVALVNRFLDKTNDVRLKVDGLKILSESYDQLKDYKASSKVKNRLLILTDSINTAEKEASLNELQVKFDTEQKVREIEQLQTENKIKDLQAQQDAQTRLILLIVLAALFIIAMLFYSRFRSKARTNALLDSKNQELAKLNQTKDRLFSIISHDLKSPLSSFHLITKSLSENLETLDKAQLKEYLLSLQESSGNIKEMMDNLLKWALAQTDQLASKMEAVEVNKVVKEVISQMRLASDSKSITIEANTKEDLLLEGDSSFVEIVLRNLLSNSLKFTPSGKSIQIETEAHESKAILRVIDEGVGMDQSDIEKLLSGEIIGQEIQNSTEKGTGLGVTLVQELVKKMNGDLSVRTEKGKGTTFEISFNRAA